MTEYGLRHAGRIHEAVLFVIRYDGLAAGSPLGIPYAPCAASQTAPRTIPKLVKSLAVHRRQPPDSAPNLSKLGHLSRFYSALTGPIMVKALLLFGLSRASKSIGPPASRRTARKTQGCG